MLHRLREVADRAHILRVHAAVAPLDRILRDHRVMPVRETVVVNPREMRDVDEAFGLTSRRSVDIDRGRQDLLEVGIVPVGNAGNASVPPPSETHTRP